MQMLYSFQKKGDNFAYAQEYNLDASYKDLVEVCKSIRKLPVAKAMALLTKAEAMEMPILYRSHNKKLGHRHELGGKKGRYPIKAVRLVRKVLVNAINNAKVLQLNENSLTVAHAAANKQSIYPRLSPKGRRMRMNYETARLEIVVRGVPKKIAEITPAAKPKKEEGGKAEGNSPSGAGKKETAIGPVPSAEKSGASESKKEAGAIAPQKKEGEAKPKAEKPRKDATAKLTKTKRE